MKTDTMPTMPQDALALNNATTGRHPQQTRRVRTHRHVGSLALLMCALALGGCATTRPEVAVKPMETVYDEATLGASQLRIAESALQSGDLNVATSLYARLAQSHPTLPVVWLGLGDANFLAGELEAARLAYVKAAEVDPGNTDAVLGQARIDLRQRKLSSAIEKLSAVVANEPGHPLALAGLGVAYDMSGQASRAQALFREGLRAHPDNSALRANLGLSLALNGQPREAINILLGPTGLSAPLPQERDNLALAYGLLGREDAAEDILSSYQPAAVVQDNLAFYRYLRTQFDVAANDANGDATTLTDDALQ